MTIVEEYLISSDPSKERDITSAFYDFNPEGEPRSFYEHGRWFVWERNSDSYYAAVDCVSVQGEEYIDFEQL